jgi:hypothetical protein
VRGPVEDLVKVADDLFFGQIVDAARKSPRFRRALATNWIDDPKRIRELTVFFKECPPRLPDGVVDDATGP